MQVHMHSVRVHVEAGDQHRVSSLISHLIFGHRVSLIWLAGSSRKALALPYECEAGHFTK